MFITFVDEAAGIGGKRDGISAIDIEISVDIVFDLILASKVDSIPVIIEYDVPRGLPANPGEFFR